MTSQKQPCRHCAYSEHDARTAPVLWCGQHGEAAAKKCEDFIFEPGTEGDDE